MSTEWAGLWVAAWFAFHPGPPRPLELQWADLTARANVAVSLHDHWTDRLGRSGLDVRPAAVAARQGLVQEMDLADEQWRDGRWLEAEQTMQRAAAWLARLEREQR
jgi:hypothetical protein